LEEHILSLDEIYIHFIRMKMITMRTTTTTVAAGRGGGGGGGSLIVSGDKCARKNVVMVRRRRRMNGNGTNATRFDDEDAEAKQAKKGKKKKMVVVLTREEGKNKQMRDMLQSTERSAETSSESSSFEIEVLEMPLVESVANEEEVSMLCERLKNDDERGARYQWICVTSPEAAKVFTEQWRKAGKPKVNVASVGGGTSKSLPKREELGGAFFTPSKALGEVLAEELPLAINDNSDDDDNNNDNNREVLYPCSKKAAKTIENGLSKRGFKVTRLNTYSTEQVRTITKEVLEKAIEADCVTFGSPSAVKAWKALTHVMIEEERDGIHPTYACIGQTSATACEELELPDVWHPEDPSVESWAEVVRECLKAEKWTGKY